MVIESPNSAARLIRSILAAVTWSENGGDDRWQGGRGDPESAGEEPRGGLVVGGDLVRVALGFHEIIVDDGGSFR